MEAKTKKISGNEWSLTISKDNKPVFQTRIYKEKGYYRNDHNCQEFKTIAEIKDYFIKNLNDFI